VCVGAIRPRLKFPRTSSCTCKSINNAAKFKITAPYPASDHCFTTAGASVRSRTCSPMNRRRVLAGKFACALRNECTFLHNLASSLERNPDRESIPTRIFEEYANTRYTFLTQRLNAARLRCKRASQTRISGSALLRCEKRLSHRGLARPCASRERDRRYPRVIKFPGLLRLRPSTAEFTSRHESDAEIRKDTPSISGNRRIVPSVG